MSFPAEAQIAREIHKFAANGLLYRGSKPVMWSVVEKTALAEAEVEYEDYTSDTVYVAFPCQAVVLGGARLGQDEGRLEHSQLGDEASSVVIWTTTPWTIPGNRAIAFSSEIAYGALSGHRRRRRTIGRKSGARYILADKLAAEVFAQRRVERIRAHRRCRAPKRLQVGCAPPARRVRTAMTSTCRCSPATMSPTTPARASFTPRRATAARTSTSGWRRARALPERGIDTRIPYTVDENGAFTDEAPGFDGKRVLTDKGEKGDANEAVIKALIEAGALIARGKLKHQYPHSLALEEAGHLPQHAAMVHRDGQADRRP